MRIRALKKAAMMTAIMFMLPHMAVANEINAKALDLAGQKKFDAALALLSQQDRKTAKGYEHRFLKARILSWAGQYGAARTELDSLMAAYPENPDLRLALGNLEYYQGRFKLAEIQYQRVLSKFPDYEGARRGLENVRKAKMAAAAAANGQETWRIDGSLGLSDFNQDTIAEWDDQFLRVEYKPDSLAYHGSVQRYRRFGTTDIQLQAGLADAVRGGWDWGLEVGVTPDATFRPDLSLGARLGRAISTENNTVLYPNVTYRFDDYDTGSIHSVQPGMIAYLKSGIVLTGRLIVTLQEAEDNQVGWLAQGRIPLTEKLQLNAGYANAPEAINGFAISTQSLFGGLSYKVKDNLDVHLNLARDDRENSFIRSSANVGFTYKR
jgi:YaiO family outer membrane protein